MIYSHHKTLFHIVNKRDQFHFTMKKILVINLGSTSTKLAIYHDRECVSSGKIEHPVDQINNLPDIFDQYDLRLQALRAYLQEQKIDMSMLDAIVSRGGHTRPVESGVYQIDQSMLAQQRSGRYGRHACDLGTLIAYDLAEENQLKAMIVDPPVTDEYDPIARISGHPLITRKCQFHALSHKSTAIKYCRLKSIDYAKANLISAHLGGGISVAAHHNGRMIDGSNGLEGEGPFSTDRSGSLPLLPMVRLCFSGNYSFEEVSKMINGRGGFSAYLNERDLKIILENSKNDPDMQLILDAMVYQTCKAIGEMAAVLKGEAEAILITGGMAFSDALIKKFKSMIDFLAPVEVFPGENEMDALAEGAYEVVCGQRLLKTIDGPLCS